MKVYVASGLENRERAMQIINGLRAAGHEITYDWTLHGDVRNGPQTRMQEVAQNEIDAVTRAELVLVMLPGGKGTHAELGAALATRKNKRIIIWSQSGKEFGGGGDTCVFYHNPAVERLCCDYAELPMRLAAELCAGKR